MMNTVPGVRHCTRRLWGLLCFLLCVLALLALSVYARENVTENGKVTMTASLRSRKTGELVVTVKPDSAVRKAYKDETLYLFVLPPYESGDNLTAFSPVGSEKMKSGTEFHLTATEDMRYARFVAAVGNGAEYKVIGETYLSNPEAFAENNVQRKTSPSLKGITVSQGLLSEAEMLGVYENTKKHINIF